MNLDLKKAFHQWRHRLGFANVPPARERTPDEEILRIERSVRCHVLGLCGLIPLIGFPLAVLALMTFRRVKRGGLDGWNAGARYLKSGRIIGGIALVYNTALWAVLVFVVIAELA